MKKIITLLLLMTALLSPFQGNAAEKIIDYNVNVRITFGFGNNYDMQKFSEFALKTVSKELTQGYTMFESKGVWTHPKKGQLRENNIIILCDMLDNQQAKDTVASVAEKFLELFRSAGGSVYVVKTPIIEAKSYF